jgi:hypothetical protein
MNNLEYKDSKFLFYCSTQMFRCMFNQSGKGPNLPFDLSGMGGPTRSLCSRQHSYSGHWGTKTSVFSGKYKQLGK